MSFSCSEEEKSDEKRIVSFNIFRHKNSSLLDDAEGVVNEQTRQIKINVPHDQSKASLVPSIEISPGATIDPANEQPQDFTDPVTYTVTAENGSSVTYIVSVISNPAPAIESFEFTMVDNETLPTNVQGIVDENAKTVHLLVPYYYSKTGLIPSIGISPGASVTPASGEPQDFSNPIIYTVTAVDGSKVKYSITVDNKPMPIIDSIVPSAGSFKMEVTINGNNFNAGIAGNKILFNGAEAEVVSVSTTKIVAKVPQGVSTGPISLTIDGGTIAGPNFKYYDIYIIGNERDEHNNRTIPKIWTNGVGAALHNVPNNSTSLTSEIILSNSDIYIAGNIWNGSQFTPGYWKNSIFYQLPTGSLTTTCSDIFVDGNDVYVSGMKHDGIKWHATYWKNEVNMSLPTDNFDYSEATSIAVADGSVYVGAFAGDYPNTFFPLFWKDGQQNLLTGSASVSDIQVLGSNVHIVASHWWGNGPLPVTYWMNGGSQNLTEGTRHAGAHAIFVDGSDIFIAGFEVESTNNFLPKARVWKNGSGTSLIQGLQDSSATGLTVVDGNVIITGQIKIGNNFAIFYKFNDQLVLVTNGESSVEVKGIVAK